MEEKNLSRILEALLFTAPEPMAIADLAAAAQEPEDRIIEALDDLKAAYEKRGVQIFCSEGKYEFRTAPDLAPYLTLRRQVEKKLSRAALETLAIVAYHQPVTRVDIEEIRGVTISKGTVDMLLEHGWIQPKGRKQVPGRPLMWGTTPQFLRDFSLETLDALPGLEDLRAAGLLDIQTDKLILTEMSANDDDPAEEEIVEDVDGEEDFESYEEEKESASHHLRTAS